MIIKLKYFSLIVISLIFYTCANQQAPPGGPKDLIPPEILNIYPENGTLNFSDDYFEIDFSEYVDKLSLLDAFFVSPEINNLDYDWSGTSVKITFEDTLFENTTYTISIGSSIKDLNNQNPMEKATNISFSTGNKIDVGKVTGKVFDKDLTGTMIFAYHKVDTFANPIFNKPDKVTQVGENGEYQLLGLKNGEYRLFAIKDANGNRVYNVGEDYYGVTSKGIKLSDSLHFFSGINFKLTNEDTLAPFISNITMTDNYHLSIEYSEFLDSSKIDASNFYVFDTLVNESVNAKYFYSGNRQKHEYLIVLADTLAGGESSYLVAKNITDKYSNINDKEEFEFIANTKTDTLAPEIKSIKTPFDKKQIDFEEPTFNVILTDGVDELDFKKAIEIEDFDIDVKKINDALFNINILNNLEAKQTIDFKINYNLLSDAAGNSMDSVETFSLETLSGREFSGLSGHVNGKENSQKIIVKINNVDNNLLSYSVNVDNNQNYKFDRVLPGKYILWIFEDSDSNNQYSYGKVEPYIQSERFHYSLDTLNLRARWPVGDVLINFDD